MQRRPAPPAFTTLIAGQHANLPAATYRRRSDDDQSAYSPEAQQRITDTACGGWGLAVVARYFDDAVTGAAWQRPDFDRMLADAAAGRFRVLVVPKVDRLARDVILCLQTIDRLHSLGVTVISVAEPFDFATPAGRKFLTDTASTAEWYRRNLATEVSKGLREKAERGHKVGLAPFGYRVRHELSPRTGERIKGTDQLVWTDDAPVVQRMFALYATGAHSDTTIAEVLNAEGLAHLDPQTGKRKLWSRDTVRGVLTNPTYAGWVCYRGDLHEGAHDPLIDRALWDQCVSVRAARARTKIGTTLARGIAGSLSGVARCACCGAAMHAWQSGAAHTRQRVYHCKTRRTQGRDACGARMVPEHVAIAGVRALLAHIALPAGTIAAALAAAEAQVVSPPPPLAPDTREAELRGIKHRFISDEIGAAEYERLRAEILSRPQAPAPERRAFDAEAASAYLSSLPTLFDAATPPEAAALLRSLFARIYLRRDRGVVAVTPAADYAPVLRALLSSATLSGVRAADANIPEIWESAA